ncbi:MULTISPECIES: hypothetical protein [unclassified Bradyrhizobium]|uniref:hypothetical protein n=1 Tax=unclassified Bradyrhizobium TaxID=2631580 RepID=UPI001FFA87E5|nr:MULTISPECIES: hypothetical protein [unclassified Bradyrhizobium]
MTDEAVSPLRRRMIEDMTIRKFAPKTQHDYVQRIKNFAPWRHIIVRPVFKNRSVTYGSIALIHCRASLQQPKWRSGTGLFR